MFQQYGSAQTRTLICSRYNYPDQIGELEPQQTTMRTFRPDEATWKMPNMFERSPRKRSSQASLGQRKDMRLRPIQTGREYYVGKRPPALGKGQGMVTWCVNTWMAGRVRLSSAGARVTVRNGTSSSDNESCELLREATTVFAKAVFRAVARGCGAETAYGIIS